MYFINNNHQNSKHPFAYTLRHFFIDFSPIFQKDIQHDIPLPEMKHETVPTKLSECLVCTVSLWCRGVCTFKIRLPFSPLAKLRKEGKN